MLLPEYLEAAPEGLVELYSKLDETIIRDVVRRLVKTGGVTLSAAWQAERLQDSGLLYDEIIRQVSQLTDASEKQVRTLFQDAGIEAMSYDFAIYEAAGLTPLALNQSPAAAQVLRAGIQKTQGYLKNLSLTTASTTQTTFINAVTLAEMQAESGAFDYITAIRNAVRDAAQAGTTVLYPTGHKDKLDVAVRRATLTGISQTTAQISDKYADDMGCDLVETTAHPGARPEHQIWQGKVFSRSGSGKYPDFVQSTGYGTGVGLCGWNCRHSFFPYFEGLSSSVYPRDKIQTYTNQTVKYNDHNISYYEATQTQRGFERHIRATKRELAGYDEGIQTTDDEQLRNAMQEKFNNTSVRLKQQESSLKDFLNQTGLDRQREREQSLGFSRSQAQKAVHADKQDFNRKAVFMHNNYPKTIEEYKNLRYNNPEKWKSLHNDFKEKVIQSDFDALSNFVYSLDNITVRKWYTAHDNKIPELIDNSLPLEDRARQAFELRNAFRTQARELMQDQETRKVLDTEHPNKTFEETIQDKMIRKGLSRDEALSDIIKTATKTNKVVNKKLGLEE